MAGFVWSILWFIFFLRKGVSAGIAFCFRRVVGFGVVQVCCSFSILAAIDDDVDSVL